MYVNLATDGSGGTSTLRTYGSGLHSVRGGVRSHSRRQRARRPARQRRLARLPQCLARRARITGTVKLQGRTNHSGATVTAGGASTTTGSDGRFTLSGVPAGTYTVRASMTGYLYSEKAAVVVTGGATTGVPDRAAAGG